MICEIFAILFVLLLTYNLIENAKQRKERPPGPLRWPVIGNLIELLAHDFKYPHLALDKMAKKYGDVMSIGYGVHDAVVISSYEAMKTILQQDEMLGRYVFPYAIDRSYDNQFGLIWEEVPIWRDVRRFLMKTLRNYGFGKTSVMEGVSKKEIKKMISHIGLAVEKNNGIIKIDGSPFAVCSTNILLTLIGGQRFEYDDPEFLKILGISVLEINMLSLRNILNAFPFLRLWFPKWTHQEDHLLAHRKVRDFMSRTMKHAKEAREIREDQTAKTAIEAIWDEIDKNHENPSNYLTEPRMTLALLDVMSGSEVMGPMLKWAFLFLTLNPDVQTNIVKEISKTEQETGEPVSACDYELMPYTQAAMYETLRMANISPIPPQRNAVRDCYYKNYKIPKGTVVMWNLHPILIDSKFWGDPKVFRPERFLDGTGRLVNTEVAAAVFGFGKRVCAGAGFAWELLFLVIIELLKTYTFEAIPGKTPSFENPYCAVILTPKSYFVKLTPRNQ